MKHRQLWLSKAQALIALLTSETLHLLSIITPVPLLSVSGNHHSAAGGGCYLLGSFLLSGKDSAKRHTLSRRLFGKDRSLQRDWSRPKGHQVSYVCTCIFLYMWHIYYPFVKANFDHQLG